MPRIRGNYHAAQLKPGPFLYAAAPSRALDWFRFQILEPDGKTAHQSIFEALPSFIEPVFHFSRLVYLNQFNLNFDTGIGHVCLLDVANLLARIVRK